jgi:hypothetical protein
MKDRNLLGRIVVTLMLLVSAIATDAQILDGTVQGARYRVSLPLTFNLDDGSIN